MLESEVIDLMQGVLITTLKLAGPILLFSMSVGLVISILQTTTSIQEQTLTFVPKLFAIFLAIMFFFAYMLHTIVNYTQEMYAMIVRY